MIIDAYCHISLSQAVEYLKGKVEGLPEVPPVGSAAYDRFYDDTARLKYMDKYGVDIEVLSMGQIEGRQDMPRDTLLQVTKIAHDSLAEMVKRHPDRYVSVGILPTLEGEFLDELDRAIRDLGMKGCLIYSNIFGKPLDSPEFLPFWEKMAKYDLPVLIHPTNWPYYEWIDEFKIDRILGWPFDSSVAMARLVLGGVMDRLPSLKIIIHHLGGMIPFYSERVNGMSETHNSEVMKKFKRPLLDYFKMFYGDTVVAGSMRALECGVDFFGSDHVVFGTDYPYGTGGGERWTQSTLKILREIGIPEEDKTKILEGNARRLYKL